MLAAKPLTSPVIPPPIEIKQSSLEKFLLNSVSSILFIIGKFLLVSLALKKQIKTSFFFRDFFISVINFFGTFLSTTIRHLLNDKEFCLFI